MESNFSGFPKETFRFFADLQNNNSKQWFEANRTIYNEYVLNPAQAFVVEMGERLRTIVPQIMAIPKIDKSIFRLHRDVRFSKNKEPYKTQLAMFFWEGTTKKLENPGFYLHLNPTTFFVGIGMYMFPKDFISFYRDAVVDSTKGEKLKSVLQSISANPKYELGWKKYKRIPQGYDADHPNAELLLHGGIGFQYEEKLPDIVHSAEFVDYCFDIFKDMAPVHYWLRSIMDDKDIPK